MRRALFVVVAALNLHGSCDPTGCAVNEMPVTMTEARARVLAPDVEMGLAVSTTHIFGDCRPKEVQPGASGSCDQVSNASCARDRGPLRVFVLMLNQSVPREEACADRFAVSALAARAVFEGRASDAGELVVPLQAGHYTVYVTADDRCAVCGIAEGDGSCRIEVTDSVITARALVVDEATH